ncbi:MAG TPA: molybdopterin-guanine dinucleotide biosynthesis protein B [candidate division Zixibacteria bacterium]|nr:molybdopterin-guanine dinucleotide biosynthesis protein B [candidate division Zixibacteria bacterium]
MRPFEELLNESSAIHGHLCAGQVLGVRMAMVGCREVGIDEPRGCKKLIVCVEMDRCATDAIQAVTGCSLGKRTLKFFDYGKMAATFVNQATGEAVRVLARDDARRLAGAYAQGIESPHHAQREAYRIMPETLLFSLQRVGIRFPEEELPGVRGKRVLCQSCGEGINFRRERVVGGKTLCIPCARGAYLPFGGEPAPPLLPKVVLVVGFKKSGKTSLVEKLVPELTARGYRVATIKHHHSAVPVETDRPGTDTWRHRQAGATAVALVCPTEVSLFQATENPAGLDRILPYFAGNDLVLVEGFHDQAAPKIEVLSPTEPAARLCNGGDDVLAIVGGSGVGARAPHFASDEIEKLADLVEREVLGKADRQRS